MGTGVDVTWSSGRIDHVVQALGNSQSREVDFTYDGAGNVATISCNGRTWQYTWASGNLVEAIPPVGPAWHFDYSTQNLGTEMEYRLAGDDSDRSLGALHFPLATGHPHRPKRQAVGHTHGPVARIRRHGRDGRGVAVRLLAQRHAPDHDDRWHFGGGLPFRVRLHHGLLGRASFIRCFRHRDCYGSHRLRLASRSRSRDGVPGVRDGFQPSPCDAAFDRRDDAERQNLHQNLHVRQRLLQQLRTAEYGH